MKCESAPTLACFGHHTIGERKDVEAIKTLLTEAQSHLYVAAGTREKLLESMDSEKEELEVKLEAIKTQIVDNKSCLEKLRCFSATCVQLVEKNSSLGEETAGLLAIKEDLEKAIKKGKGERKEAEKLMASRRKIASISSVSIFT